MLVMRASAFSGGYCQRAMRPSAWGSRDVVMLEEKMRNASLPDDFASDAAVLHACSSTATYSLAAREGIPERPAATSTLGSGVALGLTGATKVDASPIVTLSPA